MFITPNLCQGLGRKLPVFKSPNGIVCFVEHAQYFYYYLLFIFIYLYRFIIICIHFNLIRSFRLKIFIKKNDKSQSIL